jgi:hypothetical protein
MRAKHFFDKRQFLTIVGGLSKVQQWTHNEGSRPLPNLGVNTMAGKATRRLVTKLTEEQWNAVMAMTALAGQRNSSDFTRKVFAEWGANVGIEFPDNMERPGGLRNPALMHGRAHEGKKSPLKSG